jgi:hypothetical protein
MWIGETAVILGGGPSLSLETVHRVVLARLDGRCRIVCVNDAIYVCAAADWVHGTDGMWWRTHVHRLIEHGAIKTTLADDLPARWGVRRLVATGPDGFDPDPAHVRDGGNGVFTSIHALIHAGVGRVLLLGVDMKPGERGRTHWHAGHPHPGFRQPVSPSDYAAMARRFETLKPTLAERGIDVLNCSPNSALRTFQSARIFDLL